MRNLKRALSLALASVMLLGMMVVGTSAASYPDVDENDNVEAIEVLNAVKVMIGRQGNFEPDESVNRHEMAVIMAKLVLGVETADSYVGSHPFTDVVPWADKYVAACYENGLVAGTSATTYSGTKDLTAVEAAAMMLRALGYKDLNKGYQGDWRAPITAMANQIRLFSGVASNPSQKLNRNQVAQLALNTLKSPVVDLKDGTFTATDGNGQLIISGGNREYIVRSSYEAFARAINDTERAGTSASMISGYTIELGEHLYNGKLKLNTNAKDKFGRPSNNWQYDGKDIGTYVNDDLKVAEYTTGVTGAELYDLLTYTTINDNALLTWLDGADNSANIGKSSLVRSNKKDLNGTGTGVLTEVFVDLDHDEVTISSINTWLAKANSDYNKSNETLSLKVYTNYTATGSSTTTKTVDVKDVPEAAGVKKDEYKLVYMSSWDSTVPEVVNIFDTEILSDSTVTKWSSSDKKVLDKLTTGGSEYKTNVKAFYDRGNVFEKYNNQLLTDNTYNIYMDRCGNVIGVDLFEGTKNYVFITGYDRIGSNISVKTADAAAIFMDGTMDVITVNVTDTNKNIDLADEKADDKDSAAYFKFWKNYDDNGKRNENRWYTYTVNSAGVYTLTPATRMFATDYDYSKLTDKTKVLDCANLYVEDDGKLGGVKIDGSQGRALGEDASVYITVSTGRVDTSKNPTDTITDVESVYTGAQDVKLELRDDTQNKVPNAVYTVYDSDHYIIASIVLGEAQGAAANYAYILGAAKSERYEAGSSTRASEGTYYWEFDAVYEGEKQTLQAKTKYPSSALLNKYTVQELRFDGNYVTDVKTVADTKVQTTNGSNAKIADMKVYDVGQVVGTDWVNDATGILDNTKATLNNPDYKATNPNARIGGTGTNTTIYLQGRTLYTSTDGAQDVGLALARDAKAVTIQMEDGERTVTNHDSVDEAVSRLADRSTADGVQFKGRIVAVLDGRGVAQWVILISDTELVTGTDPNYGKGGGNLGNTLKTATGNIAWAISPLGTLNATVTYTAPEFAAKNAEVTMKAIGVYKGDILIGTLAAPAAPEKLDDDGHAVFSYASKDFVFYGQDTSNLTFKQIGNETLSAVKVKYVDAATGVVVPVTNNSTKTVKVADLTISGANDLVAKVSDPKYTYASAAPANVDGVTLTGTAAVDTSANLNGASEAAVFSNVSTATVTGEDYVTVKITLGTATPVPVAYTVAQSKTFPAAIASAVAQSVSGGDEKALDKFGVTGATTDTLKVEWAPAGTFKPGASVQFTATVAGKADAASYDVTIYTSAGTYTIEGVKDGAAGKSDYIEVTSDITIENVTAKIHTPKLAKLEVKDVSINEYGTKITINFNTGVCKTDKDTKLATDCFDKTTGTSSAAIINVEHTAGEATVTVTFDKPLADGEVLKVKADVLNAGNTDDTAAAQDITVALTDGVYSIKSVS